MAFDQRAGAFDDLIPQQPQRRPNPRPLIQAGPPQVTPNQDAASAASAAASGAQADRTRALTRAELDAIELENEERRRRLARPQGFSDADLSSLRSRFNDAQALEREVNRYEELFRPYEGRTTLGELLPWHNEGQSALYNAGEAILPIIRRMQRTPGDPQAQGETAAFSEWVPSTSNRDVTNRQIVNRLRDQIGSIREEYYRAFPNERAPNRPGEITRTDPRESGLRSGVAQPGQNEVSGNVEQGALYFGPISQQFMQEQQAAINAGQSRAQINALIDRQRRILGQVYDSMRGIVPNIPQLGPARYFSDSDWQEIEEGRRRGRTPNLAPGDPVDVQRGSSALGSAADSDVGAALTSYAGAMGGDAIGFFDEDYRNMREGLRQQRPGASLVGDIGGSLLPTAQAQRAIGRIGAVASRPMLRYVPQLGSNVGYSALQSAAMADPENRLGAAAMGGAAGLAGDVVGGRVAAGAGRALTGARNASVRYLNDRGVPLTLGQIASGGGRMSRVATSLENALESVPLLGDSIRARRMDSFEGVNRAAFNDALEPIGANTGGVIGEQGSDLARGAVGRAYDSALGTVRVNVDEPYNTAIADALARGERLPSDLREHFRSFVNNRVNEEIVEGQLSGAGYQALRQEIRQQRRAIRGQLGERTYDNALKRVEDALTGLMERQAPGVVPALNAADTAFRRTQVVRGAVARGRDREGVFTPSQLGTEAESNARRFASGSASTTRPFFELQRNAQNVLPSTLPNSGTADRQWVLAAFPAVAAGAAEWSGAIDPKTAALFGALGLPYTRAGQQTFQKLLVSRPESVRQAGEAIIAQRRWGSRVGAGGSDAVVDPNSPPPGY